MKGSIESFDALETIPVDDSAKTHVTSSTHVMLDDLIRRSLVLQEDWDSVPQPVQDELRRHSDSEALLAALVQIKLLTPYQASRIRAGKINGLFFGNYRVLDRLGAGSMGIVFKADHVLLRRHVALKALPSSFVDDEQHLSRFLTEIRSVAGLQHPNIVAALDADHTRGSDTELAGWYFLVMEFVPGEDLDKNIRRRGPLPLAEACNLVCQVAGALAEAHQHGLVHRDIKPSNIMVTPEGQAKLLDFGLARRRQDRHLTEPGAVLGTLDYMAPEQAGTGAPVDHRADVYALGGILCWCLTGKPPFPARPSYTEQLLARQAQIPPTLNEARPELPPEIDSIVSKLMAIRPEDRYPTAQSVIGALLPFLSAGSGVHRSLGRSLSALDMTADDRKQRVLIVDDEPVIRKLFRQFLQAEGLHCEEASNGLDALETIKESIFDLVLLDINMPRMSGPELLRALRECPPCPNLKVIMLSGQMSADEMSRLLSAGADDYLPKPPSATQLVARAKAALNLKIAQDRSDRLNSHLFEFNAELERGLKASAGDLNEARNGLLLALAELAELRSGTPANHLQRLQRYARILAEEAAGMPAFAGQINESFVAMLECCAPLHDIGFAALPDHIIYKTGKFDHDERLIMQTHAITGAEILQKIARRHRSALAILQAAADIAHYHHESFDGGGYPDRLAGTAIPLSARLVALADVYGALRSRRPNRPALGHHFAVELITEGSPGRFDPHLLTAFRLCAPQLDRVLRETPD